MTISRVVLRTVHANHLQIDWKGCCMIMIMLPDSGVDVGAEVTAVTPHLKVSINPSANNLVL